jgi:hypothetical protein
MEVDVSLPPIIAFAKNRRVQQVRDLGKPQVHNRRKVSLYGKMIHIIEFSNIHC